MPIVDVELVTDRAPAAGLASALADAIGEVLASPPGSAWVRLRTLGRDKYGESGGTAAPDVEPVFVTVLAGRTISDAALAAEAVELASVVARLTGHPEENVHILYEADARGRVAFGGRLVPRPTD